MSKKMLVNAAQEGEVRVAIVEDQVLEDLSIAVDGTEMQRGNIYKGTVVTVETGLQAAFVDYGEGRNGFITFNDIHPRYYNVKSENSKGRLRIQDALKPGAKLLVQVHKEAVGNKGAALTTDITMPGRYLVYTPLSNSTGVSRKIEDEKSRKRLKDIVNELDVPDEGGVIVRTAGQNESPKSLREDFQQLLRLWGHIRARFESSEKPTIVHREPDVIIRTIRDYLKLDVEELIVDDSSVFERLTQYFTQDAPDIVDRLKLYRGKMPIFSNYGLERQLSYISSHKVPLPSGGSIVINPTEALTAVDVNSGKSRGQDNQEIMAYQTNLEAAEAVARQLRLRDVGGLIVVDFIDMMETKHRRGVTKALKDSMKKDKARVEIGRISKFGLLELSRQRIKARLLMSSHLVCPHCEGSGYVMTTEFQSMNMLRRLQELAVSAPRKSKIMGRLPVPIALYLLNEHRTSIVSLEEKFQVEIILMPDPEAVGIRDAFEIKIGGDEAQPSERGRRERKGRERRPKSSSDKRSSRSTSKKDENELKNNTDPNQAETQDQPAAEDRAAAEDRGKRTRRGSGRKKSTVSTKETSPEHSDITETNEAPDGQNENTNEASARRAAARERIRARRAKRNEASKPTKSTQDRLPTKTTKAVSKTDSKAKTERENRIKNATRQAAKRVRERALKNTDATVEQKTTQSVETVESTPQPKAAQPKKKATARKPLNLRSKLRTKLASQVKEPPRDPSAAQPASSKDAERTTTKRRSRTADGTAAKLKAKLKAKQEPESQDSVAVKTKAATSSQSRRATKQPTAKTTTRKPKASKTSTAKTKSATASKAKTAGKKSTASTRSKAAETTKTKASASKKTSTSTKAKAASVKMVEATVANSSGAPEEGSSKTTPTSRKRTNTSSRTARSAATKTKPASEKAKSTRTSPAKTSAKADKEAMTQTEPKKPAARKRTATRTKTADTKAPAADSPKTKRAPKSVAKKAAESSSRGDASKSRAKAPPKTTRRRRTKTPAETEPSA